MKHLLYSLLGILLLAGCKEDKYNVIIPMSDIYLSAPQDGATIDLNDLSTDEYSFSWEKPLENGAKLFFCASRDFKQTVKIDAGKSTSFAMSALAADQYFSQLGIKAGQEALLYWTVKETGNTAAAASDARTIRVKRMSTKLLKPEDMAAVALAENAPETAVQFEWDTTEWPESTSYSLCFSLDPEMKQTVAEQSVEAIAGKSSLTHEELQALLDLTQSLELERDGENFDIVVPEIEDAVEQYMGSILPPDNVYDHAVAFKPQIKEQEFLLESQKKMLKVARAGYYPKLNFGASYSNGYYHYSGDGEYTNLPFSDQLKNNGRKTIGFSLSIPLFNRFQVRNSVRSARINIRNRELMMENTKKVLYKEIQQAYYNATAAQEKYTASDKSVLASKEAFSYAEDRYAAGKSTVFEYSEAKTKYAQSLSEQAQAKYDFIFRTKILDFYNGTPITL